MGKMAVYRSLGIRGVDCSARVDAVGLLGVFIHAGGEYGERAVVIDVARIIGDRVCVDGSPAGLPDAEGDDVELYWFGGMV